MNSTLKNKRGEFQDKSIRLSAELVKLCEREEPDPGPPVWQKVFSDGEYESLAETLLKQWGDKPLWIFAYGSLLWKPAFESIETRRSTAHGWQRAFCLEMRRWRGSPMQPGLMLGLQPGGNCEGMAYRLPDADRKSQLTKLLRREVDCNEDVDAIETIKLETKDGNIEALAFWANASKSPFFVNHDISTEAQILARACGHIGSGATYLFNTVSKLRDLDIFDEYIWELQNRVADEIVQLQEF